jgi:hypothetical protein
MDDGEMEGGIRGSSFGGVDSLLVDAGVASM